MAEDDIFKILRRTPIAEMDAFFRSNDQAIYFYCHPDEFQSWLSKNGWEEEEFMKSGKKYADTLPKHRR